MMSPSSEFTITVAESDAGQRFDQVVAVYRSDCSRSFAATLIQDGQYHHSKQNQKTGLSSSKPGKKFKAASRSMNLLPWNRRPSPWTFCLKMITSSSSISPPGLVVHPAPGNDTGTLVNGLLYHCPELGGINAERRPGIVHRLDKDTSGTMVVAKNRSALENLSQQFKARGVQKTYLALVHGVLGKDLGRILLPIGRHPVDRKKMSTISAKGRDAETIWRVKIRYAAATLLALDLKTGRTHQIRVHCASMRHPIVGDAVYTYGKLGSKKRNSTPLEALLSSAKRQMLHARHLRFTHPVGGATHVLYRTHSGGHARAYEGFGDVYRIAWLYHACHALY